MKDITPLSNDILLTDNLVNDLKNSYENNDVMISEQALRDIQNVLDVDLCKRRNWNEFIICLNGDAECKLQENIYHLIKNSILIIPAHYGVDYTQMSDDIKILHICFGNSFIKKIMCNDISIWNRMMYQQKDYHFMISDNDMKDIICIWESIKGEISFYLDKYDKKIIYMNIGILCCKVLRYLEYQDVFISIEGNNSKVLSRADVLFERFLELLAQTSPKRRSVGYYANQLSITPNYLLVICSRCSNRSVATWIQESVQEEVKYYLMQLHLSIKEVAERTGFSNMSFFARYVKKHFGCTPTEFRKLYK